MDGQCPIIVVVERRAHGTEMEVAQGGTGFGYPTAAGRRQIRGAEIASAAYCECVYVVSRNASSFIQTLASPRHRALREHARRAADIEIGRMLWFRERILYFVHAGAVLSDVYQLADAMRDYAYTFDCRAHAVSLAKTWPHPATAPKTRSRSEKREKLSGPDDPSSTSASKRTRLG